MRRSVLWLCMLAVCLTLLSVPAFPQDQGMHAPPNAVMLVREQVKPGKAMAHTANETAWTEAYKKAHFNTPGLAIVSVTGESETWFLVGYPSFAAMEQDNEKMAKDAALRHVNEMYGAKESDLINETRTLTLRYRPDLSYKAGVNIGDYKYFSVAQVRFRMGESVDDFYKKLNDAREKASLDSHIAVYQVVSGAPVGTFISFTPMKSMSTWDEPPNEALQAAQKETGWTDAAPKAIMNVEFRLFAFAPSMSIVPSEVAAANPSFWNPKPMMAKRAEPAGGAPERTTRAAKKEMKK